MLTGKVALVTGGGRGIGEAIAEAFSRAGARLVLAARTRQEVETVAARLRQASGPAIALACDVADPQQVERLMADAVTAFGPADVLVNSAGVYGPIGPFAETDLDGWTEAIRINLLGTVYCTRAVLPHMIRRRSGKIINLSGGGAVGPFPRFSAYATSKAAVVRFTETVAEEVRAHNVQVNAIAPGAVNTRLLDQVLEAGERAGADFLEKSRAQQASGGTSPAVGAELALHLASSRGDGITGKLLSAVWDDWKRLGEASPMPAALYTLRRIDGRHFIEGPQA